MRTNHWPVKWVGFTCSAPSPSPPSFHLLHIRTALLVRPITVLYAVYPWGHLDGKFSLVMHNNIRIIFDLPTDRACINLVGMPVILWWWCLKKILFYGAVERRTTNNDSSRYIPVSYFAHTDLHFSFYTSTKFLSEWLLLWIESKTGSRGFLFLCQRCQSSEPKNGCDAQHSERSPQTLWRWANTKKPMRRFS